MSDKNTNKFTLLEERMIEKQRRYEDLNEKKWYRFLEVVVKGILVLSFFAPLFEGRDMWILDGITNSVFLWIIVIIFNKILIYIFYGGLPKVKYTAEQLLEIEENAKKRDSKFAKIFIITLISILIFIILLFLLTGAYGG